MSDISVHLTRFPQADLSKKDTSLTESMALVSRVVQIGLAWRSRNKIRVRQPLQTLSVSESLTDDFLEIVKDELNIKEIHIDPSLRDKVTEIIKPDGKKLWKKLWSDFKDVLSAGKRWDFEMQKDGTVKVAWYVLEINEFERSFIKTDESLDVEVEDGIVVSIDGMITPALEKEWYIRDLVRYIQEARKEAWYDIADRIQLSLSPSFSVVWFEEYIQVETLSTIVDYQGKEWKSDYSQTVVLWDDEVVIALQR